MANGRIFDDAQCKAKARRLAHEVAAGKFGTSVEARGMMQKLFLPLDAAVILATLTELGALDEVSAPAPDKQAKGKRRAA